MSESKQDPGEADNLKFKLSVDVKLSSTGEVVTLKKLKAGQYYKAQKAYVSWVSGLQKMFEGNKENISDAIDESGQVDQKKLEANIKKGSTSVNVAELLTAADEAGTHRIQLLSFCMDTEEATILNSYYPEDIEKLVNAAVGLNDFMENVKKSVAPTVGGA